MSQNTFRIIIVGGGTAGWLSAAFLSRQLPNLSDRPIEITLVEASDIATIGVGEATVPSLRETLAACGIHEREFLTSCDATFKHGIKFVNWRESPKSFPGESYFHPFGAPLHVGSVSPVRAWSKLDKKKRGEFADVFSVQSEIAQAGRAPKHRKDQPYQGALSYAYHLDAGKFAEFLKVKFRSQKVTHHIGRVESVQMTDGGQNISSINLDDGTSLSADFFIDCTGFSARLINHDKENTFIDKNSVLFVDRAVTTGLKLHDADSITGYTTCTAQQAGWMWDISLQRRRGIGHVYSSKYTDDQQAKSDLAAYLGKDIDELEIRELKMRIGYFADQWRGNCVAIGLASGFLEPLESTGIYLTEMANWALLELLPRYISGGNPQAQYSEIMSHHYENIVDFLKLHYAISARSDTEFWKDNRDQSTWPDTLKAMLDHWKTDVPSIYDFGRSIQCFSATNYQFVLFGMGWKGHEQSTPSSEDTAQLLNELAVRRNRLKQFVLRDTETNVEYFRCS